MSTKAVEFSSADEEVACALLMENELWVAFEAMCANHAAGRQTRYAEIKKLLEKTAA